MIGPTFQSSKIFVFFSRLQLYINKPLIYAQYFYSRKSLNKILFVTPFALPSFFFLFPCFLFLMDFHSKKGKNEGQVFSCCSIFFCLVHEISTDLSIPIGYYPLCFTFARFSSMITPTLATKKGERLYLCFHMQPVLHSSLFLELNICVFLSFHLLIHINVKNVINLLKALMGLLKLFLYHNIGEVFILTF